ncbi:MAG TPA: hypothetical protein VLT36_21485 [Candidatus Dormibacteraeota bacterium]|nr:hypothetical protein [Candidatus Dormibacteraeota bacterium]
MNTLNLLLATSDIRVGNLIENLLRQTCGDDTMLHCTRAAHVSEFTTFACEDNFDLVIFTPETLRPRPGNPAQNISTPDAITAVKTIKTLKSVPMIAVAVAAENEVQLSHSGVDVVLGRPFNCEQVKSAVRPFLPEPAPAIVELAQADDVVVGWKRFVRRMSGALAASRSLLP